MTEYEKAYATALTILKKLSPDERGWLRHAGRNSIEEDAFHDAYQAWLIGDWKETPETVFILTVDDVQAVAQEMIGRELTEEELAEIPESVQAGLEDWNEIMKTAIRCAVCPT